MSWECQGRQYHGWFGSGTCADALDAPVLDPATVTDVAYSAFGYLPQNQRRPYESWLRQGGLKQLASALPGWAAGSGLPRETFRERYFGEHGDGVVAAHAQDAGAELTGLGPRDDGRKARAAAGQSLASLVKAARPEAMGRVMAVAARRAAAPPPMPPKASRAAAPADKEAARKERNVKELARIMYAEARGPGVAAMEAVGHTVVNRMKRNGAADVAAVSHGYSKGALPEHPTGDDQVARNQALQLARDILEGRSNDPTRGATHYYTPERMAKEGEPTGKDDVKGGLEQVPGVIDKDSKPIKNYRPSFATSEQFSQITVPNVPENKFKFYRKEGTGHVR
jgi:spore germination cell wall hydrolase CwlJ-like protein